MKQTAFLPLLLAAASSVFAQNTGNTSIAMLNYLATETRVISRSTNKRLVLEETYDKLINNTNPGAVDETTKNYLQSLLEIIESFRILTLQRERLEYIFENEKARAITQALPTPLYLLRLKKPRPKAVVI